MGIIFSLSGCKAIGKTTLIKGLKEKIPELVIREGFRKTCTGFDMNIESEYYENERWYIEREIREIIEYKNQSNPVMLLRGPEDLEFYVFHYPRLNGFKWDIESNLKKELQELRNYRSDHILYLDASLQTILERKKNDDTKNRSSMEDWLINWQPYIEKFMKSNSRTTILNTDVMDSTQVFEWTYRWMMDKIFERD